MKHTPMLLKLLANARTTTPADEELSTDQSEPAPITDQSEHANQLERDRSTERSEPEPMSESTPLQSDTRDVDVAAATDATDETELPLDVTFEILKNRRRRLILKYLENNTDPTPIGELSEHIAAIENGIDINQLDAQQRKRVYIGLYQCHLPKMDDANVVEYNQSRGLVEVNENAAHLYDYLESDEETQNEENGQRYLLHTLLFGVFFSVAQVSNAYVISHVLVFCFLVGMLFLVLSGARRTPDAQ